MSIKLLKFMLIFIVLLISIGAASASQVTKNTNNSSLISNHTNIISGNVTKCSDGSPFNGVTITVSSNNGKYIANTKSNSKGNYYLKFIGNSLSYKVSASYPGHVTSIKTVTVQKSSKTSIYSGQANFRLGPMPSITITSPSSQLLNQTFNFSLTFNNTGNDTGFGPMAQLILPSQIKLNNATFLGSPVTVSSPLIFPSSGVLVDPLTGLTVTGTPGYTFYTLQYPLGSFTKGQPSAVININALLLGNSTLGNPLNITAYPVFRFGANATGTIPLRGNPDIAQVTPTVIKLTKTSSVHEQETATGRNYPITYTLNVDVATGQTVKNVVVTDVIPKNLQFIKVISYDGGTPITIPSTISPGGILSVNLGNITGILGTDRTITYQVFAPKFDNSSQSVIDPVTGNPVNGTNSANVTGVYNTTNVSSSANYTVNLKALAVQKSVVDITNPSAPKPTDILQYTVNFQVSDYFSLKNMLINDDLGDGQKFLTDSSHNPTLTLNLPNIGLINLNVDLTDPTEFQMVHDSATGITHLFFNISQILINNNYTGVIEGGNYTGSDYGATQGYINFWSRININYENPNKPIVSKDSVKNDVTGSAQLVNSSNNISDSSQSLVAIVSPTASKVIVNVKRNGVNLGPVTTILPGDQVTFSLNVNVPTTNLEQFYLIDYLPIPLFLSNQFSSGQQPLSTGDAFPNTGEWRLASDDTLSILSGVNPSLVVDNTQNTLAFYYGNVYNLTQPSSLAHILFTITATGEPMADGLYLTNLLNVNYNNSFNEMYTDNQIVSIITGEPQLIINKTASPNSGRQAGDHVTYTITITNTGHAPAYNVVVKDDLLSNSGTYITGTPTITAVYQNGSSIDLTGLGNLFGDGINFGALYPLFGTDGANNTIILTYNAILSSNVYPLQLLNNTATITNFTALPPTNSTNFVRDPSNYQANATVSMLAPNFNKTYEGSQGGPSTGSNLTIGETGRYQLAITLPAGKINDLIIKDNLPVGLTFLKYEILNNLNINLPTCVFTQIGNLLTFSFPGTTTTTNGQNSFFINLDFIVANNNTNNPPHSKPTKNNTATMNWNNPGSTTLNGNASVTIIEPNLQITKKFNPAIGSGGKTVTVTLTVKNTGDSTAYNVLITDPLTSAGTVFNQSSVVSYNQNGFIFTYPANIVTFTGGNITPGQSLTFTFNITVLTNVYVGPTFNNTAYANYYSLLNGTIPDINSRNYTDSGWATFRAGDPTINKAVVNSTIHSNNGNLAIGEHVTYRITVVVPQGQATNLTLNDILPAGFGYVSSILVSNTWNGNLASLITTVTGTTSPGLNVNFLFNGLTTSNIDNNTFYIDLEALVLNVTGNTVGSTKTNNVNLTWNENSQGPFTSSANTKIVGPTLTIVKSVTPLVVDGGDKMKLSLLVTNTGSSPAFEIILTDVLDTTLFDLTTFTYIPVPGYTFILNGNTLQIIGNPGTFINNTGTNFTYFNFTLNSNVNVPSNSTFSNRVNATYYSMPSSFPETRISTATSNLVNIKTVNPSITKVVDSTSEPDSQGNNVMIGEVVVYKFNLTIPQGTTLNVILRDILPSNLQYNTGTLMIMRSSNSISATGFSFNLPAGQYEMFTGTINPLLTINLGNITFTGTDGLQNGTVTLIFNTTVLNTNLNQNGTQIPNNVTFNFTNASGTIQSTNAAAPTLNVIVPHLSTTKTASPQNVEGGQNVKFTIKVSNDNTSNGASAYNLEVLDQLVDYYNLNNIIITPSDPSIVYTDMSTSSLLHIIITKLNPGQYLNITYNATLRTNVTYGQKVNNTITFTGTSLPGDHGTNDATPGNPGNSDGKRTGDPTQPAGAVNNLISTSTATVTVRNPTISKNVNGSKTVKRTIGDSAYENLIISLPVGTTNNLKVVDVIPPGLQMGSTTYTLSNGISVNQFSVLQSGNTYTFDFGNITAANDGNITISYLVTVQNITTNVNGNNLTNNATLFYQNITGGSVNAGYDTATIQVVEPNLIINKTASKNNLKIGENFTYTLNIKHSNSSTSDAYNIIVSDTLPNGLGYVSGSAILPPNWTLTIVDNTLNFSTSILTLADNNATITFNCTVNNDINLAGQNITNTANINYTSTTDGGRTYNQSSSSKIHILGADLLVKKTGTSNVHAGQGISYTVTITNLGPDTANNVIFTDNFIATWFNQLINPKYSINGGLYLPIINNPWTLSLGDINSGNSITINIMATVSPSSTPGIINNTATANSDTTDPNPNNNNDTKLTNVDVLANLSITKTGQNNVAAGNSTSYTVTVVNNGPSDAQDVLFSDVIPVLSGVTWTLNGVNMGVWTGTFNLGVLTPNQVDTLVFAGLVPASTLNGTVINNTAFVSSPTDPDSHNSTAITNVNTLANLSIQKTGPGTVQSGNKLSYTVTVTNNGPSDAQDVLFGDVIPVLSGVTWTLNGVDMGVWTGTFNLGVLAPNQVDTLVFVGLVPASTLNGTVINNTAFVSSPTDPDSHNSTAVTNVNAVSNLSIKKIGPVSVVAGHNMSYTVTVVNNGPSDAQDVLFGDVIPVLSGVTWTLNGVDMGVWTGSFNLGVLAPNQVDTLVFVGLVPASTLNGTVINNTAFVSSPTDPDSHNSTAVTNVNAVSNLSIKKIGPVSVVAGHNMSYTVTVVNNGPSDAQDVLFGDVIPVLSGVTWTLNGVDMGVWTGSFNLGVLAPNQVDTLVFVGLVPASTLNGTVINNTAFVSSPTDPDSHNSTAITNVNAVSNLSIKKIGPVSVVAGHNMSYTVTVVNNGPSDAQDVLFGDVIPVLSGVTWTLNGVDMGVWTGSFNLGVLAPNQVDTLVFVGLVPASTLNGTVINNTAFVSSPTDPDSHNSTAITNVNAVANLSIQKTGPGTVQSGNKLSYTVTVTNNGPSDAQGVVFSDVIPVLSGVTWTLNGVDMGVWTGSFNLGVLAPNQVDTLVFVGLVPASTLNGTVINNTAFVSSPTDPDSHNSTAITNVNTSANLSIQKTGNSTILPGQTINYQIFIKNNGPSDALNVIVADNIDEQITNTQYSLTGKPGTWSPWLGYLDLGTLASGNNLTVYITGTLLQTANRDITNTASVTSPTDPEIKNSTVITHLNIADIGITKNTSNKTPNYLKNVKFTIKCHNYGPDQATGVVVTDLLPKGLKFVSFNVTQGSYDPNTGIWNVGTLNNGESAFLIVIAQVTKTGNITNTAAKTGENEYDPNTTNNQDSVILNIPQAADLSITKTVKPAKPKIDQTVNFTIIVKNNGPDTALEVYVIDKLPQGIKYISTTTNYGHYDPITGNWTIGTLPKGSVAVLNIKAVTTKIGNIVNHASVHSITYDPTLNDTTATAALDVQKNNNHHGNGDHTHHHTIPMKDTGIPVSSMLFAVLLVVVGLIMPKRK